MQLEIDNKKFSLEDLPLIGQHNFKNYISAILAAKLDGIPINDSIESLKTFKGVRRRMELVLDTSNIKAYDDFAHHPTAIRLSCAAIKEKYFNKKILGLIELGSNTMSAGYHNDLLDSFKLLDQVFLLDREQAYKYENSFNSTESLLSKLKETIFDYDIILIMTNKDSQKFIKPIISYVEKK